MEAGVQSGEQSAWHIEGAQEKKTKSRCNIQIWFNISEVVCVLPWQVHTQR